MNTILTTVLSTITGLIIGYLTKLLKGYKDRDNVDRIQINTNKSVADVFDDF